MQLLAAVSTAGSVTAAAASLGMSQPAASAMLRQMETRLGFELFSRKRRRLELTASGRALLPEVTHALAALESVERRAESMGRKRPGRLVVGTISAAAANMLPAAVKAFRQQHPHVSVVLRSGTALEVIDWAVTQRIDLGVILGSAAHEHLGARRLAELGLVCAMTKQHRLASRAEITPRQLARVDYIAHSRHLPIGALTAAALEAEGLAFQPAVEVGQFSAACALAEADCGVAILDTLTALYAERQGLVIRPLRARSDLSLNLIWPAALGLGRLAESLTQHLADPIVWKE
jgi:DNA-binding transcriptional LysR family regulator